MTVPVSPLGAPQGPALRVSRHAGAPGAAEVHTLGPLHYGGLDSDVPAPLLQATAAHDLWCTQAPVERGQHSRLRWARTAHWCWGAIDCEAWDDRLAMPPDALVDAAQSLYGELLDFLRGSDTPHLLRLWNYLPHINRMDGGLERYRHFNLGRQRALLAAQRSAFDGAPAACALGAPGGPLKLRFLAGRHAPLAIENPRQVSAYRYPNDYGPASPSFSRAALCDIGGGQLALLISGTASIVGHATVHVGDWRAQLDETLRNLEALCATARSSCNADFRLADSDCVVYLRDPALAGAVREAFIRTVGAHSNAAKGVVLLQADVCRSDLLLEIEAHVCARGTLPAAALSPYPPQGTR